MATLTTAQKNAIGADILASGDLNGQPDTVIAGLYNAAAAPAWTVWKTNVPVSQIGDNIVATELDGLASLPLTRLQVILWLSPNGVNPSLPDRRSFFSTNGSTSEGVFSGAGGAATRPKLTALWKRTSTRLEKLLSTGTGSVAVPATMSFEGAITAQQVSDILAGL